MSSENDDAIPAECEKCKDHWKLYKIWADIDEIMQVMRPHRVPDASMDGRYPCWRVWLPKEGRTERKTLKDALIAFIDQREEIFSEKSKPRP
jgi:hypothetical protein